MRRRSRGQTSRELAVSLLRPLRLRRGWRDDRKLPPVAEALADFQRRWDVPSAPDRPTFLFGSAWRSGSTLLQRMVMGGGRVLVWGEPWNRTDLVPRLAESFRGVADGWPAHAVFYDEVLGAETPVARTWTANVFPDPADLVEGHRALLRRTFAEPARRRGYPEWGVKFVRLGIAEAAYLRFLFPEARMAFVHRDPFASWVSYRSARLAAYRHFPDEPVFSPWAFGRAWATITGGFITHGSAHGVTCVRYEDFAAEPDQTVRALELDLGMPLDRAAVGDVVGSSSDGRLFRHERMAIARSAGPIARRLGYER